MQQQTESQDKKQISRRDMIKAAGVLSLGLMYTKPFVERIQAKPAFNGYGSDSGGGGGDECLPPKIIDADGQCHEPPPPA